MDPYRPGEAENVQVPYEGDKDDDEHGGLYAPVEEENQRQHDGQVEKTGENVADKHGSIVESGLGLEFLIAYRAVGGHFVGCFEVEGSIKQRTLPAAGAAEEKHIGEE